MRTNPTLRGFLAGGAALALLCGATVHGGSYLLLGRGGSLPKDLDKSVRSAGGAITQSIPQIGLAVVESANPAFAAKAGRLAGVEAVVPNIPWVPELPVVAEVSRADDVASAGEDPEDPLRVLQWALEAIDAPGAWAAGQFGQGVRVAILDSGIAAEHTDIEANLNKGLSTSFVPGEAFDEVPVGEFNHGTHVAGIVAAPAYNAGIIGVAYKAEIVAVKVLSAYTGSGSFDGVIQGIVYAAEIDADVINMSLGATLPRTGFWAGDTWVGANEVSALVNAINRATSYARQQGTVVIASAGNSAIDRDHDGSLLVLPADCTGVIAVAATGPFGWRHDPTVSLDRPASYSNYGQSRINFAAPGGDFQYPGDGWYYDMVYSPAGYSAETPDGRIDGWWWAAGTSMAAPHVAGVAALIIGKNGGPMHPAQVEAALRKSADDLGKPGKDDFYGHGRVNAANAVQ